MDKLDEDKFQYMTVPLRDNILTFFDGYKPPDTTKKDRERSQKTAIACQ